MTLKEFYLQSKTRFHRVLIFAAVTVVIFVPLSLRGPNPELYLTAVFCTIFGGLVATWVDYSELKKATKEHL